MHSNLSPNDVVTVADTSLTEEAVKELEEMGLSTAGITKSTAQVFSEVVNTCLLAPLQKIGVHNLSTAANLCPRIDNNVLGRMIDRNHKACFFFTPVMIRNKKLSLLNRCNKAEITSTPGSPKVYNHTFWRDNLDIKRLRDGALFSTLEMGAFLPPWSIAESFKQEHEDAMHWMASHCAAFPDKNTLFLSVKQEYATVFLKNMESPLVAKARLAGYRPLFLMKNAIVTETSHFGLNGYQVTSINVKPKSYLALVGFFKGNNTNLQLITLKNDEQNFMVLDNRSWNN